MMNRVWTGIMIVICMAALTGCHHAGSNRTADTYSIEQIEELENDTKTLESALTKEYDLNELRSFFKDSRANESIGFGSAKPALMFREVDHRYPVEILRTGGYSVYRVRQGGYFYVFWVTPLAGDADRSNGEPSVYFSSQFQRNIFLQLSQRRIGFADRICTSGKCGWI